jgi:hypothetical protein
MSSLVHQTITALIRAVQVTPGQVAVLLLPVHLAIPLEAVPMHRQEGFREQFNSIVKSWV